MTRGRAAIILLGGSVLFYLPFAARFFMGDDWLWLATGIRTFDDPAMLLDRPVYGYWRPLYSGWMSLWTFSAGVHPWVFSTLSLLLHGLNAGLVYSLLARLGSTRQTAGVAAGLFAVYYLNAPAVAWISATPDLIVAALSLTVCLMTLSYIKTGRSRCLTVALLCWLSATLAKESGFVAIAPAALLFLMYRENPFKRPALWFTLTALLIGAGYLIFYFSGRVYIDKALVLQPSTLVNLWYLLAYLIFPLSGRIAAMVPSGLYWLLPVGKVFATVAVPFLAWLVWRKGEKAVRFFTLWSLLFVLPIVLFDWNVTLLTLYPERTISRFLYTSNLGTMVLLSWGLVYVWQRGLSRMKSRTALVVVAAVLIVMFNGAVIYKVTAKYRYGQSVDRQNFTTVTSVIEKSESSLVTVIVPEQDSLNQFVADTLFVKAMALVGTGREVSVRLSTTADSAKADGAYLWWNDAAGLLSATPITPE